jgi:hypothetical protein
MEGLQSGQARAHLQILEGSLMHTVGYETDTKFKAHLLLLSAGFDLPGPSWKGQYIGASFVHLWFKVLLVLRLRCLQPLHTWI